MNYKNEPWYYSWIVIILAFFIFWPVGVVLIILKGQNKSKNSLFTGGTNKKMYLTAGILLILMGIYNLSSGSIMWGIFMIIGGGLLVYYAEKLAKRATRNKQYINMIVNQQETSIDKIASVCNVQYQVALKELNQLVSLGALQYAEIDEAHHMIKINRPAIAEQNTASSTLTGALNNLGNGLQNAFGSTGGLNGGGNVNMEPASKIVTCSGCGAKVTLNRGQTINCEYCDTPISFQ